MPSFPPLQLTSVFEVENVIPGDLEIVTVSLDEAHVPLLIVHTNLFAPITRPVTPDNGFPGVVTTALPVITVHNPLPAVGVFPASVAVEEHAV